MGKDLIASGTGTRYSVVIDGTLFQEYALDVKDPVEDVLDGNGVPDGWLNVAAGDLAGGVASRWLTSREAIQYYRPVGWTRT